MFGINILISFIKTDQIYDKNYLIKLFNQNKGLTNKILDKEIVNEILLQFKDTIS